MTPQPYSSRVLVLCGLTFRSRTKGVSGSVTLAGPASIGWMAAVNFIIDSDYKWLLLAFAGLWGAALALFWLEGRGESGGLRMSRRSWLVLITVLSAVALYRDRLRAILKQTYANVRAFDLPSAGAYDALVASVLEGFYARVAGEVAAAHPGERVLEVGSGPGRLAVRLVREAPGMTLTGVDISGAMVERATHRAAGAGLSERVRFEVGDVAALPFSEQGFDGVVSTLSLHHWSDPASGLAEIHRVLKPGGEARIYDLAHWLWPPARGGDRLTQLAAASPFGEGEVEMVRWPGSVPAFVLLRLRRAREDAS